MQKVLPPNTAVDIYGYADNQNLGNKFKPSVPNAEKEAIDILERSLYNIKNWMDKNCLEMHDGKTEFMIVGSKHQLENVQQKAQMSIAYILHHQHVSNFLEHGLTNSLALKTHMC